MVKGFPKSKGFTVSGLDEIGEFPEEPKPDMVNSPDHYTSGSIECIDYIKEVLTASEYIGYLRGNMIKYQHRCRDKGKFQEDLKKIEWYAKKLNQYIDGS